MKRYSPDQIQFLKENVEGRTFSDLLELFNKSFKVKLSLKRLRSICSYHKLRNCINHRHYTPEEIQFVKRNIRGRSYAEMRKLFNKNFKLRLTKKQFDTLMYKHKLHNGMGTWNGYAPANKGKKHKPQLGNYRPIGTERVMPYENTSYVEVKTGHHTWKRKHVVIWEKANGKIPKGHVIIFGDGNTRNFALDNLILVSRAELGVMNRCGLIYKHKDLTAVGKTIADVKMAIGKRKRKARGK